MSVAQIFEDFCRQLVLPQDLRSSIAARTGRIASRLNNDFRNLASDSANRFYAGSYGRGTAAPGLSDVDLICILPYEVYAQFNAYTGNKQSSLLQSVRTSLNNTYPNSAVIADGQIVKIGFTDGITFEIVPVFLNKDGSYTYADSNNGGSWKSCKPKHEIDAFYARDIESNRNLAMLGRMARAWRDHNSVNMSGMLIDTLAYQFMASWQYRDKSYLYYDYMTRDFFTFLGQQDRNQTYWLAPGSGSYVYRSGAFELKARPTAALSIEAIKNCEADQLGSQAKISANLRGILSIMSTNNETLEGQLREIYGRVAYTHKTHEKMADQALGKYKWIKFIEIACSALSASSLILAVFGDAKTGTVIGAIFSTILLGLLLYFKEANLGELANKHAEAASKLWGVRERLLSALVDLRRNSNAESATEVRDDVNAELESIYRAAPRTNGKAYAAAQKGLKMQEELFFSDDELDHLLPKQLRSTHKHSPARPTT